MRNLDTWLELKASGTRRNYRTAVLQWDGWLNGREATPELAIGFIASLKRNRKADATIKSRYHALHSWYEYLELIGLVGRNPFRAVGKAISIRQEKQVRPTRLIPFDAVLKLLELPSKDKIGVRDRDILALLFGLGLRRSEVRKITLRDITVSPAGILHIVLRDTKAGKTQEQPIPDWAWEPISELSQQRMRDGATETDPLCTDYYRGLANHRPLSDSSIARLYKRYLRKLGIDAAPHSARATAATLLKSNGVDDRDVALFLRHSTTRMVQVYDKRSNDLARNPGRKILYK